ncbi:MAG: hypothetical protein M1826_002259 [Phylliscum demangeonii]|nr:MAG: hypothetical protein M1826_002259 [Phylliscum demangeonii]
MYPPATRSRAAASGPQSREASPTASTASSCVSSSTGGTLVSTSRAHRRRAAAMAPMVSPVAEDPGSAEDPAPSRPRTPSAKEEAAAVAAGNNYSYGSLHRDAPTATKAPDAARTLGDLLEEAEAGSSSSGEGDRDGSVAVGAAHLAASTTSSGRGLATEPVAAVITITVASSHGSSPSVDLAAGDRRSVAGSHRSASEARDPVAGTGAWNWARGVATFLPVMIAAVVLTMLLAMMSTGHLAVRGGSPDRAQAGLPAGVTVDDLIEIKAAKVARRREQASAPVQDSIHTDIQAIKQMMEEAVAGGPAGESGSVPAAPSGGDGRVAESFHPDSRALLMAWLPEWVVLRIQDPSSDHYEASLGLDGDHGVDDSFWLALRQKVQAEQSLWSESTDGGSSADANSWATFLADNEFRLTSGRMRVVEKPTFIHMLETRFAQLVFSREQGAAWLPARELAPEWLAGQLAVFAQLAINDMVRRALASTDWLSPSLGALVEPRLTSATYKRAKQAKQAARRVGPVPIVDPAAHPPVMALIPWETAGECWCTAPVEARLVVIPAWAMYPKAITVEFPSLRSTPDIRSAPRQIDIYGSVPDRDQWTAAASAIRAKRPTFTLTEPDPWGWLPLARVEYDVRQDNHIQTFPVDFDLEASGAQVVLLMVSMRNNWGDAERTCLYRVRVHGNRVV